MFDLDLETEALSHRVIGASIQVHRELGPGFLEGVYQRALSIEMRHLGMPHEVEFPLKILYRGEDISAGRMDTVIPGHLLLELKTVDAFADIHRAQVISYLKATGTKLGILMNFKTQLLKDGIQRIVL